MSSGREHLEKLIARCWGEVLQIAEPSRDADFFELGGDSIQGLELTDRLAVLLPVELPLVPLFFQDPTIAGFAASIAAELGEDQLARLASS
jgi:hypothetical protein